MKILLINNHHSKVGGAETVYFNTIELLLDSGIEVITLSRKNDFTLKTRAKEYFIDYTNSFNQRIYNTEAKKQIEKIIEIEKPQLAHLHNTVGGITFSILPALKKTGIPVVMTIHDFRILCPAGLFLNRKNQVCEKCGSGNYLNCIADNCSRNGIISSFGIAVETYFRNKFLPLDDYVNHIMFVSKFTQNKFLQHYGNMKVETSVIHNSVKVEKAKINRGKYFLFFGRLAPEKGILTLLKAFSEINDSELHIVGDGPLMDQCKSSATNNVKFFGYLTGSQLKEQIENAFFTIIPSECYENLPLSVLESFSLSKPVIGSKLGGITELIINGKNGFTFESKNYEQLKVVITNCKIITDDKYFEMCHFAFESAKEKEHSIYFKNLLSCYEKILVTRNVEFVKNAN